MSESTRTSRAPAEKRLTYQQWKRRKMLRLARNWVLFLAGCAAVVALLTGGKSGDVGRYEGFERSG